ncbi:WD40 repeat domain-containing protein [Paenibacillus sp. FSL R5-0519]|uniref:WD40 repeat domain-containing protein n=1 Tax=Paenibacillus sp. FSL R5-0519 TaxID=2921648 RepID=UPI0030DB3CF4
MAQLPMYAAMVNSPGTELAADITATDTEITVLDASKLPAAPNLVTVGGDETAETILYTGKTGNTLTGCTRGFEGTAKGWAAGTQAARNHTAYDYEAGRANIADLDNAVTTVESSISTVHTWVGDLSELQTTDKDSLVDAINEVFTHVDDGKNLIETAVIVKGGTVAGTSPHSFEELADGIETIETSTAINGQVQQTVTYAGNLVAGDPIYTKTQFGSDVTITYPPSSSSVRSATWSPDDTYLAVSTAFPPYFAVYKRNGSVFTKLSDPATMPGSSSIGNAWSPDGTYLSVVLASSPYFIVYKRDGDTLTKLPDAAVLPTSNTRCVAWSPDGTYLALGHNDTPYISIYKRSGDVFTKLSNPSVLPTGVAASVNFDPSGVHLVVGHGTSPFITIYKRSGDTFTKLSNPSVLPTGLVNASDFSSSGDLLSCAYQTTPYLNVYKVTGDTFEKIPDFADLPTSGANGVGFMPGTDLMSVGTTNSPYLLTYQRIGDTFKKVNPLSSNPPVRVYCVEYSRNATFLAVGLETGSSSGMLLYSVSMAAYKSSNNIADLANADGAGYALSSGITGEKKDAIIIWR